MNIESGESETDDEESCEEDEEEGDDEDEDDTSDEYDEDSSSVKKVKRDEKKVQTRSFSLHFKMYLASIFFT